MTEKIITVEKKLATKFTQYRISLAIKKLHYCTVFLLNTEVNLSINVK